MKKVLLGKIRNYLLIIISVALLFTGIQLYQEKKESNRQYESFLNHFYFELTSVMQSLDSLLEQPVQGNELEQALLNIERKMEQTSLMLDAGSLFVDRDIMYGPRSIFENHPLIQFADDDTLVSEEVRYLENLKNDLDSIQTGLYSDETGQENPDLSINAFNDIIKGSGLESGFSTEQKSVAVPFQMVDLEEVPERIRKWVEKNESSGQKKVFLVDGKTYVMIPQEREKTGSHQVTITKMVRKGGGITVTHKIDELSGKGETSNEPAMAIAELEMETERSFQFTSSQENETFHEENITMGGKEMQAVSAIATAELVPPEKLSKDGQVKK